MRLTNFIVVGLVVSLIASSSVLGGVRSVLLCLHAAGDLHLASVEMAKNCCHSLEEETFHECKDCNDVELYGIDLLATRYNAMPLPALTELDETAPVLPELYWETNIFSGPNPSRAPPDSIDACIMVAKTVVMRL